MALAPGAAGASCLCHAAARGTSIGWITGPSSQRTSVFNLGRNLTCSCGQAASFLKKQQTPPSPGAELHHQSWAGGPLQETEVRGLRPWVSALSGSELEASTLWAPVWSLAYERHQFHQEVRQSQHNDPGNGRRMSAHNGRSIG